MKIEVNIDKKILLIVIGIFLIGTGVYAAVNTSLPYHPASQVQFNDGSSLEDMKTFSPGNITLAIAPTETIFYSTSYTLYKEIQVAQGGTLNVSFEMKSGNTVYGKIYVNGVAVGTEKSTGSSSFRTYYEAIIVNPGDKVQLYARQSSNFGNSAVRNFKLGISNELPIAAVTYDAS